MTRDEAIDALKALQDSDDKEMAHFAADVVLCRLLRALGYEDVVKEWNAIDKWYA